MKRKLLILLIIALGLICLKQLRSDAEVIVSPNRLLFDMEEWVKEAYRSQLGSEIIDVRVQCLNPPKAPIRLKGDTLKTRFSLSDLSMSNSGNIAKLTLESNQENRNLGFPFHIEVKKPVWVVKHYISAQQPVDRTQLAKETRWLSNLKTRMLDTSVFPANQISRINLIPGMPVQADYLESKPAVYQNDVVTLVLNLPNAVQVKTQATALQTGVIGEKIKVARQLPNRRRVLQSAIISNPNTVEINQD